MRKSLNEERLEREVETLRRKVEALEYRLETLTGSQAANPVPKLNGAKFRIVHLIGARFPRAATHEALIYAMTDRPDELLQPLNTLKVHMVNVRKALAEYGVEIETIYGTGYRMTDEGYAAWRQLMDAANLKGEAA